MKKILFLAISIFFLSACGSPQIQQDLFGTQIVVEQQAESMSRILTATAEAPLVALTQTQGAFDMIVQYSNATGTAGVQTQVAQSTATAAQWTPTPSITPSPIPTATVNLPATVEAHEFAVQVANDERAAQRAEISNTFYAIIIPLALLVGLLAVGYVAITVSRNSRYKIHDQPGYRPVIGDVVTGEWIDMDTMPNYATGNRSLLSHLANQVLEKKLGIAPALPAITAVRMDEVKKTEQMIKLQSRTRLPKALIQAQTVPTLPGGGDAPQLPAPAESAFLLPDWEVINGWQGEGIPYYTENGLEVINISERPHLATLGTTGTGKSRRFLRPAIACLLAAGHRVVIIGKSKDYWPFENHPNAHLIKISQITRPEEAENYANVLQRIVEEMNRRDQILTVAHQSTWANAGRPQTFIALDELGNALRQLAISKKDQIVTSWIQVLVSEGRANGMNILIANQRATGMAGILSQMGKAIFRVEPDEESRHRSLAGAGALATGYFIAKFGKSQLAGAFDPSDDQLISFMQSRPVKTLEPENWIDGQVSEVKESDIPYPLIVPSDLDLGPAIDQDEEKIIEKYQAGLSVSGIVRSIWGVTGGGQYAKYAEKVKAILDKLPSSSPEMSPESG